MTTMKTNIKSLIAIGLLSGVIASCKQDMISLQPQETPQPVTPSKGSADFTKYVAIGNSLTAGFQAGALFTEGQNNSFPKILSKQFSWAMDPTGNTTLTFNQPDINSVNGYNSSYSNPGAGVIRGRLVLYSPDGTTAHTVPTPAGAPGVPAPYNTADLPAPYTGDKTKLNNLGVPGILLGQCLLAATGGPSSGNPYYNALYARFATNPGTSTIIGDALAKAPTFFTFDLGNNDVLGYATTGGDTNTGGSSIHLTTSANFQTYYSTAIGAIMQNSAAKGVVVTIPDVTAIPFFLTVKWNAIPLDAPTASYVTSNLANNYNAFLAGMKANGIITDAELNKRKLTYVAGQNAILISDETLTNLAPYMAGPYAALAPYAKARQTTSSDLVPLSAGAVLGTYLGGDPSKVYGVSVPMADKYILIKEEIDSIKTYTTAYNNIIKGVASNFSTRVAVADVNAVFNSLIQAGAYISDGVMIQPSFSPPFGAFSEDGVHPNSRGYAFLANIIIDAINNKTEWGAVVPKASLADYGGTGLPLHP